MDRRQFLFGGVMATVLPSGKQQYTANDGSPLAGGKLYTYAAGTSTPKATYSDAAGAVPNTNPVILDARGEASVFWNGSYKVTLTDASGSTIWTVDGITDSSVPVQQFTADLADPTKGASMVAYTSDPGGFARTTEDKLRESISLEDKGGSPAAAPAVNDAALAAALATANEVTLPGTGYQFSTTLLIPAGKTVRGRGAQSTSIVIVSDVVGVRLNGQFAKLIGVGVTKTGANTHNGVEVGDLTHDGGRGVVSDVYVSGFGNDGIQVRNGNLGTLENIKAIGNGRDGIHFTKETVDNNAWTLQGFLDLIGNTRDGLHLEMGSSANDPYAPKTMMGMGIVAQSNGRYGAYVGTRSNSLTIYAESNTSGQVYLDTYALGNEIKTVEGSIVDASSDPKSNIVYNYNAQANYWRIFQNKVQFSGVASRGIRIANDDATPGTLDLEKIGARAYAFRVNTGDHETLSLKHDNPALMLYLECGGWVFPAADNTLQMGYAARRWSQLYAGTATINTSDEREKQDIQPIDDAVLRAWAKVQYCQFKFKDAVQQKGGGARWHVGLIAQRVKEAFESEGIDPFAYGILCYDEWAETPEERNEAGEVVRAYEPAGNRYGIRYEEALALECAYLRSRL